MLVAVRVPRKVGGSRGRDGGEKEGEGEWSSCLDDVCIPTTPRVRVNVRIGMLLETFERFLDDVSLCCWLCSLAL